VRSDSECALEFAFHGQFRDAETGWYNYGYRYYLPALGRWACKDPIMEAGGNNLYKITNNDAVNQVDLLGLATILGSDGSNTLGNTIPSSESAAPVPSGSQPFPSSPTPYTPDPNTTPTNSSTDTSNNTTGAYNMLYNMGPGNPNAATFGPTGGPTPGTVEFEGEGGMRKNYPETTPDGKPNGGESGKCEKYLEGGVKVFF